MTKRKVLVVDWSANSKPKTGADSIWIGDACGNRVNPPTRLEAIRFLQDVVEREGDEEKWLIAFDFSFGVPWWDGRTDGGGLKFWEKVCKYFPEFDQEFFDLNNKAAKGRWEVANSLNRNDFKQKNFWGCPEDREKELDDLSSTKGDQKKIPDETRFTDTYGAKSPWQLLGAGSVGSQMLMGICHLQRWLLEREWRKDISVWPFEDSHKRIVFAETFPSHKIFKGLIDQINNHRCGLVKDAVQVTAVARCLEDALLDEDAWGLDEVRDKVEKEGLILTPEEKLLRTSWSTAELNKLFLGPDEGPCKWIGLLKEVSKKIESEASKKKENPPEQ